LCGGVARLLLLALPGALWLPAAIAVGALTYVAAVRLLRPLPTSDIAQLCAFARSLPIRLRRPAELTLRLIGGVPIASATTVVARDTGAGVFAGMPRARDAD
jgi:hypothetical protein